MKWHCFFGFFKFPKFQIGIAFFVFFGIGFGQNSKLETVFFFFGFFLVYFWFFWLRLWPTFEIGNWFFGLFWFFFGFVDSFFLNFLVFLAFDLRVRML